MLLLIMLKVVEFGRNLADDEWHTLYIKRRANEMDVWVDDNDKVTSKYKLLFYQCRMTLTNAPLVGLLKEWFLTS